MKLSYFDLLSPDPVRIQNVGGIVSPKLRDISFIGYDTYQNYLSVLLMDLKGYFSMTGQQKQFDLLSDKERLQLNLFELLTLNKHSVGLLQESLNFFIDESVSYSTDAGAFLMSRNGNVTGIISKENYTQVCDVISQLNCIKPNHQEDLSKIKNKKVLEIMKKLQKGRTEKAKQAKTDKNLELGNIISAIANKSNSLNIVNIWDLTVFQLWDCFSRQTNNNIYDIQSMSVAAWGNKDNYFDATAWFKRIDTDN